MCFEAVCNETLIIWSVTKGVTEDFLENPNTRYSKTLHRRKDRSLFTWLGILMYVSHCWLLNVREIMIRFMHLHIIKVTKTGMKMVMGI